MEPFELFLPETFDEAVDLLSSNPGAKPIAGGTALTTLMKERVIQPDALVNLRGLRADHRYVRSAGDEIRIGALTTLRDIETSDVVRETLPVVAETAGKIASIRIRNVATIGGNLAHADPDLDLPPVLAGIDAEVVVHGTAGERAMDIKEFVQGYYQTDLEPHELVKELRLPVDPDRRGVYLKYRSLSAADWPCVGVAAFTDPAWDGVPAVYLNSVADTPVFGLDGLTEVFADGVTEAAITAAGELATEQCDPVGDARGSAWYKRRMAGEFTERALAEVTGVGPARGAA